MRLLKDTGSSISLYLCIFFISGVGIAYQIALMRIWSIAQWHHFAYMIISIAMLGFGAGGMLLTLCKHRITERRLPSIFFGTLLLLAFSLPICYAVAQLVPFETFHLVTQHDQWAWLLLLYLILCIPFLLVSACITLAFFMRPAHVGRVYFVNLTGSGAGAVAVVGLLFFMSPEQLPYLLSGILLLLAGLLSFSMSTRHRAIFVAGLCVALWAWAHSGVVPIRISEYKVLSYTLQFPDANITANTQSPLSRIDLVRSKQIRETPGQLGNYPFSVRGPLPEQAGIFFDAGAVSAVNRFDGDLDAISYLDYTTPAAPYHMLREPHVLVIGAGGGSDVLMALYHDAHHVTAVEVDPSVFPIIRQELMEFSGGLYEREEVSPVIAEGRGFLKGRGDTYDLIQIALLDAFNAAASGVYALSESYLYTREAIELYLSHLNETGILAITRWLKTPPRDVIKMFATLAEAAEAYGIEHPEKNLALIRSWNAATLLLSRTPWTEDQITALRSFCETRGFDIDWIPGIQPDEVNRFTILEEPIYYTSAHAILSDKRSEFYDEYLFDVRPATDNRPYFFQFFKWNTLGTLIRDMGFTWVPFVEWGYIALLATIVQGAIAGILLILIPLLVLNRHAETKGVRRWVVAYFASLGLAFMFLEIAFIQRFMLFLAYPIYAVAVVLASFLFFSGFGSFLADRWVGNRQHLMRYAVTGILLLTILYVFLLPPLFQAFAGWSDAARATLSVFIIAPLAFCMGIPFPCGLQHISDRRPAMLPWAWGINGVASVMGASLATLIAIHFGFRVLLWIAAGIYLLAIPCLYKLHKKA